MGFFDGLSNSVAEKTNKISKETKLKKTLSENKDKIEKLYSDLGKKVYESRANVGAISKEIEEFTTQIENLIKENEELRKEILLLNNKKICPQCGAEVDIQATFCQQCGKEQEKVEAIQFIPKGKRKCQNCNEIIDEKNVFCPNCGAAKPAEEASVEAPKEEIPSIEEITSIEEIPSIEEATSEDKDNQ